MSEKSFNELIIEEFRANGGIVGGMFAGSKMVILHSTGAKSGALRETPLVTVENGDQFILVASKAGADDNPAWYYNLKANPVTTLEVGAETLTVRLTEAEGEERTRLYKQVADRHPGFWDYEKKTSRIIPVFTAEVIND